MDESDIEVLLDGRIVLVLHSGKTARAMSTHELKKVFISAVTEDRHGSELSFDSCSFAEFSRKQVLK